MHLAVVTYTVPSFAMTSYWASKLSTTCLSRKREVKMMQTWKDKGDQTQVLALVKERMPQTGPAGA